MAGYTPVFDTVFDGTLCGKWPVLPVWLSLLPLADWRGHIDLTPEAIAARTGWPMDLLLQGIEALCAPDPRSRSKGEDGRRLVLIDDQRDWGWRVVNIQVYRDKASGQDQVDDGRNAAKVRRYKERHRQTPKDTGRHRATLPDTADTYSDSDSDSDSDKNKIKTPPAIAGTPPDGNASRKRSATATRLPADFELTEQRRAIATTENLDPEREFAKFADYWRASSGATARKHDWDATWRNWCRKAQDMKPRSNGAVRKTHTPAPTTAELEALEAAGKSWSPS
jgi:hypothetical protein